MTRQSSSPEPLTSQIDLNRCHLQPFLSLNLSCRGLCLYFKLRSLWKGLNNGCLPVLCSTAKPTDQLFSLSLSCLSILPSGTGYMDNGRTRPIPAIRCWLRSKLTRWKGPNTLWSKSLQRMRKETLMCLSTCCYCLLFPPNLRMSSKTASCPSVKFKVSVLSLLTW